MVQGKKCLALATDARPESVALLLSANNERILSSTPANPLEARADLLADLLLELQSDPSLPHRQRHPLHVSPGGSSSGAAASISLGSSLLAIGTDTGGLVRLPAAWTGVVGYKPTYGAVSRYGVVSYASSLDTVGWLARTADCADIAWRCLSEAGRERKQGWC